MTIFPSGPQSLLAAGEIVMTNSVSEAASLATIEGALKRLNAKLGEIVDTTSAIESAVIGDFKSEDDEPSSDPAHGALRRILDAVGELYARAHIIDNTAERLHSALVVGYDDCEEKTKEGESPYADHMPSVRRARKARARS